MGQKYAIDFGTTNSVIARWNGDQRETVAIPDISIQVGEHFLIPSQLYVQNGREACIIIGAAVKAQGLDQKRDNRLFRSFKRSIGAKSGPEPRIIDGAPWTDANAGQHFVRYILQNLPCNINEIEQLVITVPITAFAGYSAWLNAALQGFPTDRLRIVDESTAAAIGYAVTEPGSIVLISDFGGGTLDLSLVRLPESATHGANIASLNSGNRSGAAQVIAKVGLNLGGSDIDQWLLADILQRSGLTPQTIGLGFAPLLSACESAKITLSISEETSISVQPENGPAQTITITRAEMEAVMEAHGFFTALHQSLNKLLGQAHQRGIFKEDINHVLLVGGTSLIPSVQRSFDTYFRAVTHGRRKTSLPTWPAKHWQVENTSIRVDKPFTAVVEGALQISTGLGLDDQLTYSYGLLITDSVTGKNRYEELIAAGSRYPSAPVTIKLAASAPGQTAVNLTLAQIDTSAISSIEVRYESGQAVFISQPDQSSEKIVPLNSENPISLPLNPPGEPGKERLSASFHVDAGRNLLLNVTDLKTHKKLFAGMLALSPSAPTAGQTPTETATTADERLLPALATSSTAGGHRLSLRNLASALNLLPPSQLSDDVLAAALRSNDSMARFGAAEILCKRGDREARLIIEDVLKTGTPPQRASVVQHVYRFSWFTAEGLFRHALDDSDERIHEGAVFGLCKMRVPEAYTLALNILRQQVGNDAIHQAAIWGTFSRPDAGAIPLLEYIITNGSATEIREQALEVLGATGSLDGVPVAQRALQDPNPAIKYAAAFSWVELAGEGSFAGLADVINTSHGTELDAILRGFFHGLNYIGLDASTTKNVEQLVRAFEQALLDVLPEARISATLSLAWIQHPLAGDVLYAGFARETDPNVKAQMLRTAVNFSSLVATKLLSDALTDTVELVRQTGEYLQQHDSPRI